MVGNNVITVNVHNRTITMSVILRIGIKTLFIYIQLGLRQLFNHIKFIISHLSRIKIFQQMKDIFCSIYTPTKVKHHPIFLIDIFFYINTVKTIKQISPCFLHFLKDYTKSSKITNLRSIYHPERRDYDVTKMGFKKGAGKT